jgi:hypothetical protein
MAQKEMLFCGLKVTSDCMNCKALDRSFQDNYLCCLKGSCPSFLPQEDKDRLIDKWRSLEAEESLPQDLIKAQKEYIDFLGKTIRDSALFLANCGQGASEEVIVEGARLRKIIGDLEAKLG